MMDLTLQSTQARPLKQRLMRSSVQHAVAPLARRLEDRQFLAMDYAFRATGGIASGDELATRLRKRSEQPISVIARWIVGRHVVSFQWQWQSMVPLFQFDLSTMTLRPRVAEIVQELTPVFDDWHLAMWFVQSNAWLGGAAPVDLVDTDVRVVLDAARADRFIARG